VHSELSAAFVEFASKRGFPVIRTLATGRHDFVLFPPKGKKTDEETLARLKSTCPSHQDVQIVISDGLSASAVEANIPDLLPMLEQALKSAGITYGLPVVARFGRVAIADQIGHALSAKLAVNLIGERPGLSSSLSLSAYLTFNPGPNTISSDRTVVSNIHSRGTPAVEAGAYVASLCKKILDLKVSGVRLQQMG
jgi:ethanolamine ammonia-lyase small subunit